MEQQFYEQIKRILSEARYKVYQTADFAMVEAYMKGCYPAKIKKKFRKKSRNWSLQSTRGYYSRSIRIRVSGIESKRRFL